MWNCGVRSRIGEEQRCPKIRMYNTKVCLNYCVDNRHILLCFVLNCVFFFASLRRFIQTYDYLNLLLLWVVFISSSSCFLRNSTENLHQINTMRWIHLYEFLYFCHSFLICLVFAYILDVCAVNKATKKKKHHKIVEEFGFVSSVFCFMWFLYRILLFAYHTLKIHTKWKQKQIHTSMNSRWVSGECARARATAV